MLKRVSWKNAWSNLTSIVNLSLLECHHSLANGRRTVAWFRIQGKQFGLTDGAWFCCCKAVVNNWSWLASWCEGTGVADSVEEVLPRTKINYSCNVYTKLIACRLGFNKSQLAPSLINRLCVLFILWLVPYQATWLDVFVDLMPEWPIKLIFSHTSSLLLP